MLLIHLLSTGRCVPVLCFLMNTSRSVLALTESTASVTLESDWGDEIVFQFKQNVTSIQSLTYMLLYPIWVEYSTPKLGERGASHAVG